MSIETPEFWRPDDIPGYERLKPWLQSVKEKSWSDWEDAMRWYCRNDLFFLINFIGSEGSLLHSEYGTKFYYHQFYIDLCRQTEWQIANGGGIDTSGRRGGKSTVRTKWATIQLILNHPDISIFLFGVEKRLSRKHLRTIKDELEANTLLKTLNSDVLWENPIDAVKNGETVWGIEDGIRVKRTMIRSTQTLEAHSFFYGGPVGTGPDVIMLDDIEHSGMVGSPENIEKLKDAYSAAVSLLTPTVIRKPILMVTNTRFSQASIVEETYQKYKAQDERKARQVAAEELSIPGDGPLGGTPQYPFTKEILWQRYDETPVKSEYALQYAMSYTAASQTSLNEDNLSWYLDDPRDIAKDKLVYICIDASRGIEDPMAIWVWATSKDKKFYWIDASIKKLDPSTRYFFDEIFNMVSKWKNLAQRVVEIRVESQGSNVWAELIERELRNRGEYTPVIACRVVNTKKEERIFDRWAPNINAGNVVFPAPPRKDGFGIQSYTGTIDKLRPQDLVDYFLEVEFRSFPRASHDDALDAAALLWDNKVNEDRAIQYPSSGSYKQVRPISTGRPATSWMSASG